MDDCYRLPGRRWGPIDSGLHTNTNYGVAEYLNELQTWLQHPDRTVPSTGSTTGASVDGASVDGAATAGGIERNNDINGASISNSYFYKLTRATKTTAAPVTPATVADGLVRDAVQALTAVRPPAEFILYATESETTPRIDIPDANGDSLTSAAATNNNNSMDLLMELDDIVTAASTSPPPPTTTILFDGSVALATPETGGSGTALHAVAAMDSPLTLALLLVLGDAHAAKATHTAFRRLIQHEAACNGSVHCLELLLELGHLYKTQQQQQQQVAVCPNPSCAVDETIASTQSPDSSFEFPFFSSTVSSPIMSNDPYGSWRGHFASSQTLKQQPHVTFVSVEQQPKMSVLSMLRMYLTLSNEVDAGAMTELDAARTLMQHVTLSKENQQALASQCGGRQTAANSAKPSPERRYSHITNLRSDGHGNTPLHWASFKNEPKCIALLLKYQADPNARAQPSGWTPLHDAAYSNGRVAIALLMDAGAVVDARANSGATPLCFAAQEDAAEAAELLLLRGADLATRCAVGPVVGNTAARGHGAPPPPPPNSRFSGYTPLHYCAHYNAHNAAKVLLRHHTASLAMEIHDLNERLPIHVAVARGSSDVLRELLRAGARVETRVLHRHHSSGNNVSPSRPRLAGRQYRSASGSFLDNSNNYRSNNNGEPPATPQRRNGIDEVVPIARTPSPLTPPRLRRSGLVGARSSSTSGSSTPVSSPLLRSMIPSHPIQSSKPWNCLSQRSIDECRQLISEVEQKWTPDRHSLFTPFDRRAVAELLRVGKRLESEGSVSFIDLWPEVLSFCGRGWFDCEHEEDDTEATDMDLVETGETDHLMLPSFC